MKFDSFKTDLGLLSLRLYGGLFMLLAHGWGKTAMLSAPPAQFNPIGLGSTASVWLTVFAEVVCAFFITFGIGTRWAAVPLAITMGVAGFIVHASDPWSKKELAMSYLCVYVALICLGGGRIGLDRFIKRASN